jgi:hypothetical protein
MNYALFALLALAFAPAALADSEIVIAIRYLQAVGVSHSHLYLYHEDGKLLRQLTHDNTGQERHPLFSADGREIVFNRITPSGEETWSVEPLGKNLHRLKAAPDWYQNAKQSPVFTDEGDTPDLRPAEMTAQGRRYVAPDQSAEIIVRLAGDEGDEIDGPEHGRNYLLRDLRLKKDFVFGKMPGFYGVYDLLHLSDDHSQHFLLQGPLRVAFGEVHLNSTEGDADFAIDLDRHRLVRLGPNLAVPIPIPGEPAFLVAKEVRYVPIPKSKMTANCSYLERWDANLKAVRYAAPDTAARNYGFSMYRPNGKPAVIYQRGISPME